MNVLDIVVLIHLVAQGLIEHGGDIELNALTRKLTELQDMINKKMEEKEADDDVYENRENG